MTAPQREPVQEAASHSKYAPLYRHLSARTEARWRVSFAEIELILDFDLPDSARIHRPWWSNPKRNGGRSQALAWQAAGWKTSEVDLVAETLTFERIKDEPAAPDMTNPRRPFDLDEFWPAISGGSWPEGFAVSREQIYDGDGHLTGGPQNDARDGS